MLIALLALNQHFSQNVIFGDITYLKTKLGWVYLSAVIDLYNYDNSAMESFFASLKKEFFYRREYATIEDVEKDLFYYQNEGNEVNRCLTNSMHMA